MTLETMMSELHYTNDIEQAILRKIRKDEKLIDEIAETAYHGEDFNLCKRMPSTRLSVVTYLLLRKYDDYKAKGISDSIIFDTFRDVSLRAKLYYKKTGKVGISKEDVIWFRHIMNVVIFKIGALQFQPFEMIYLLPPISPSLGLAMIQNRLPNTFSDKEQKKSFLPMRPLFKSWHLTTLRCLALPVVLL